jgi:hypothetical protein
MNCETATRAIKKHGLQRLFCMLFYEGKRRARSALRILGKKRNFFSKKRLEPR